MPGSSKIKIGIHAFIEWIGEAIVGLIPLIAYKTISLFSLPLSNIYACPVISGGTNMQACVHVYESASQEICILTVVISGLALWSVFSKEKFEVTTTCKISTIFRIISLLQVALLYALFAEHLAKNADGFSSVILLVALASSLSLHIERAINDMQDEVATPEPLP